MGVGNEEETKIKQSAIMQKLLRPIQKKHQRM